jgi:hypothetical protein
MSSLYPMVKSPECERSNMGRNFFLGCNRFFGNVEFLSCRSTAARTTRRSIVPFESKEDSVASLTRCCRYWQWFRDNEQPQLREHFVVRSSYTWLHSVAVSTTRLVRSGVQPVPINHRFLISSFVPICQRASQSESRKRPL